MSDSLRPHGLEPAKLLCPWDFPGRNMGWVAISFSRGSSWSQTWFSCGSCIRRQILSNWATFSSFQFSRSVVSNSATPRTTAHQASLSIANSQSLLKLMFIESVMPSNHLILFHPLLLLPSVFPSIRGFSKESVLCIRWPKYWEFHLQHQSFQWIFRTDFL